MADQLQRKRGLLCLLVEIVCIFSMSTAVFASNWANRTGSTLRVSTSYLYFDSSHQSLADNLHVG